MLKAKINSIPVEVSEGTTILEAAKQAQIKIPTLCKHPDLPPGARHPAQRAGESGGFQEHAS